jgi:hypothetical protein
MRYFSVKVCTLTQRFTYTALGTDSASVHQSVLDCFGGLCSVVVIPQ